MNSTNEAPPPLHLRSYTLELTTRLGSQKDLLSGIEKLLEFDHQDDGELQRHGRKIIALTEVARLTLMRVGVKLYLFVFCSPTLIPLKSAYFKLLVFIRRRKHAFPSEIHDRVNRLLLPLFTHFVIRIEGVDPRAQLGIEELLVPPPVPPRIKPPTSISAPPSDAMPPPDFFAKKKARIDQLGEYIKNSRKKKTSAPKRIMPPKQYPAGKPGEPAPSRPQRSLTRTNAQYFGISFTAEQPK